MRQKIDRLHAVRTSSARGFPKCVCVGADIVDAITARARNAARAGVCDNVGTRVKDIAGDRVGDVVGVGLGDVVGICEARRIEKSK